MTGPALAPGASGNRAVLLSGSLGMGHDVVAEACATSLRELGWQTETLDAMALLGRRGGSAGELVFRTMLSIPGLYDAFHFSALRPGSKLALRTDAAARRQVVPRLRAHLDAHPAQLVISVFSTGASAMSSLMPRYPGLRHVVFCSDAVPHRLWVHRGVDLYLVTSAAAEPYVRMFEPEANVMVVPAVVRTPFYNPPSQADARDSLGVPAGERCVLLMSGAWGLGPVAEVAEALGNAGVHVLAVAGRNERLAAKLTAASARQPLVHPFGFTDRIPEMMAAADLVVTSSGDTCTEARTVGRPLLLLDVVPGHGRDNIQHELELGDAGVTSARPADVVQNTLAALDRVKPPPLGPARRIADWQLAFHDMMEKIGYTGAATPVPEPPPPGALP
jgi:UDP-N-acetylglucosamine:LPS N-acetylglucosamine transferase